MARLPGPSEVLSQRPDAVVDLQTAEGAARVRAAWRFADAEVSATDFVDVGQDLGPGAVPNRTWTVEPRPEAFDDVAWRALEPGETMLRLSTGRVCFAWYRVSVTLPGSVGDTEVRGCTVVFETVVDDYAEVWVDGRLPRALGDVGGPVAAGFNAPNRVVLTTDAQPGQTFDVAVFGINGPISAAPANYIWMRTATLDVYRPERARASESAPMTVAQAAPGLEALVGGTPSLERVATGFEFTEGPVWAPDGALLFSSPNTNVVYRWHPHGRVTVFRSKSGYTGADIGRYAQPGSNGLTFDPQGRLVLCQHGNRRVLRVNPHGDTTVLVDRFDGRRLNSPNDLVFRSDGVLFLTDPPFGLPAGAEDPKRELPFSGVFAVHPDGRVVLVTDELSGPNGLAFSPEERYLYVGDWDPEHKAVVRYQVDDEGNVVGDGVVLVDLTSADGEDAIDGLKVDVQGNVWICGPGGVWVVAPDGRRLGRLELPEAPHNLAWGDGDGRSLYITALTSVYRLRTMTEGIRP
jgi:gluconolactonase